MVECHLSGIAEALNVIEYIGLVVVSLIVHSASNSVSLYRREKALCRRIVPGARIRSSTGDHAMVSDQPQEPFTGCIGCHSRKDAAPPVDTFGI
jgi:hypothetical protein